MTKGSDAVYFTTGSRGKDLLQTDVFGAVKTMQAAKKLGIERYIMLSSIFALQPEKWHIDGLDQIMDYNVTKFFADNYLVNQNGLKYTILQPTNLTEKEGTGKIGLEVTKVTSNPIPDVAKTLAEIIKHDNTIGKVDEAWKAMVEAKKAGKFRSIGISNVTPKIWNTWKDIFTENKPSVNQVEFNPYFQEKKLRKIMAESQITLEAWAPFAEGKDGIFTNSVLAEIGKKYGKSNGQVILRWLIQRGIIVISKSVHGARQKENIDVFDFELSDDDMQKIAALDKNVSQFFDHHDPATIKQIFGSSLNQLRR